MLQSIILLLILITVNAVFSSAEIAVLSLNAGKLQKMAAQGDRRAKRLLTLTERPAHFLVTIQAVVTLAGFLQSALAAKQFSGPLAAWLAKTGLPLPQAVLKGISLVAIALILSYFSLVFGELLPRRMAMKNPEALSLSLSGLLKGAAILFTPLVWLLTVSTGGLLRLMGIDPEVEEEKVTEEEIRTLLSEGNEQGTIREEESEMIENVFEFNDTSADEICTHRRDVVLLHMEDSQEEWRETIYSNRHTFYPVCGETTDDVIGILNTKDYFRSDDRSREFILSHACDPPFFVQETMKANLIFRKMKEKRIYFAVVLDEYGGFSGIVTLHDIVETLVGDLSDRGEPIRPEDVAKRGDGSWTIQGSAMLDDVADALGIELPVHTYDTFSGYVCGVIQRVPANGEEFSCQTDRLRITVRQVKNHMVVEAIVWIKES
ncbi:MAG: hemolysin family protein [Clostridiales bacterium]|nr:hemolysin family protein [Clostridiales bacterium]